MDVSSTSSSIHPHLRDLGLSLSESQLLTKIKNLHSNYFCKWDDDVKKTLDGTKIDLSNVLNYFSQEIAEGKFTEDPIGALQLLSTLISVNTLTAAGNKKASALLNEAQRLATHAKIFLESISSKTISSIESWLTWICDALIACIESLLTTFGIANLFDPSESDPGGLAKSSKILMLFSIFMTLTSAVLPVFNIMTGGIIVGGTLLVIATLSLIWHWIKPAYSYLPAYAEDISAQVDSNFTPPSGRNETIEKMTRFIKQKKHIMLTGPPKIGKTATVKRFARELKNSSDPELAGKKVYLVHAHKLINRKPHPGASNDILQLMRQALGLHKNRTIVVIDDISLLSEMAAELSSFAKNNMGLYYAFSNIIGIVGEEEYENHIKMNRHFSRFEQLNVGNTTKEETIEAMRDFIRHHSDRPMIEEGALKYIFESCDEKDPQPATALSILEECIYETTAPTTEEKELKKTREELESYGKENDENPFGLELTDALTVTLEQLQKKCSELTQEIENAKPQQQQLKQAKALYDKVVEETYRTVIKTAAIGQKTTLNPEESETLNQYTLYTRFLLPTLRKHIETRSKKLEIPLMITKGTVDAVLAMKGNQNKEKDKE